MRLLLDTHVLLWSLAEPSRLSSRARDAIADRSNDVLVSAVSAWEVGTKYRLGKLPQAQALVLAYDNHVTRLDARELSVTGRHALDAGLLTWDHRDPFDRMLAVQAMVESATLVTADDVFATIAGVRILW